MKLKCCYLTIFYQQDKVFATNAVFGKKRRSLGSEKPSRKPALFTTRKITNKEEFLCHRVLKLKSINERKSLYSSEKSITKQLTKRVLIRYNVKNEKGERIDANTKERDR